MDYSIPWRIFVSVFMTVLMVTLAVPAFAQNLSRLDRERAQLILETVASDVRNNYYDPKLHGSDWDTEVNETKKRMEKAPSWGAAILEIASLLETLNDSHTVFLPPVDPIPQEYGWRFQPVGNHCFVTHVQPGSDAAAKGLSAGDDILSVEGFIPDRDSLPKMEYILNALTPRSSLQVVVEEASGEVKHIVVQARQRHQAAIMDLGDVTGRDKWRLRLEAEDIDHRLRPRIKKFGDKLIVIKLPSFLFSDFELQAMISKARAHDTVILDLRDNPGGEESKLVDLLGRMLGKEVKIADRVTRQGMEPLVAKAYSSPFRGKLLVLVDSRSASASELFARVVQLEKRGVVLGDRTAGSVMEAIHHAHVVGGNPAYHYGASISEADLIMSDGKSLEHSGVVPDVTMLPSASDFAKNRDALLAHAAEMAGVVLTPEQAGNLFPYEWPMRY